MACIAVLFSTALALLFSLSLVMFGDPTALQVAFGALLVGKMAFWMIILRLSLSRPAPMARAN